MNFTIRSSFYFKQGTCLLSFALWWIALNLNQRECTVWFDVIRLIFILSSVMRVWKLFLYAQYKFFLIYLLLGYWILESCPKCRFWGGRMMLRAQIIKKCPWVTLQGSRIVLVISYPATLKRDIIATVYDLRRSSSSNRSSKTSPLANPKSQTKTCYLSVQANKLISKFTVLY